MRIILFVLASLAFIGGAAILTTNKSFGWRVKATKNSFLNNVLGNAKGVIVPHQLVKSIGDIMIISKSAVPSYSGDDEE